MLGFLKERPSAALPDTYLGIVKPLLATDSSRQVFKLFSTVCARCHFEPRHALCTNSLKALQSPLNNPGAPIPYQAPSLTPLPPANQHIPEPCNRWLQGSAGVSWGREGGWLRLDQGTGVFEIVVTWPVGLSVCRWMSSMWPQIPFPHPVFSQSQGFDCRSRSGDGRIQWSSQINPQKSTCSAYSAPPRTCSEKV